jgi:hypothetical protein
MDLKGIVNISGRPGLFKVISSSKTGFIVEAIDETKKRFPIPGNARVAALEDISIYTLEDQVALKDVFQRIHDEKIKLDGIDAIRPSRRYSTSPKKKKKQRKPQLLLNLLPKPNLKPGKKQRQLKKPRQPSQQHPRQQQKSRLGKNEDWRLEIEGFHPLSNLQSPISTPLISRQRNGGLPRPSSLHSRNLRYNRGGGSGI